jgi:hypothetical protein
MIKLPALALIIVLTSLLVSCGDDDGESSAREEFCADLDSARQDFVDFTEALLDGDIDAAEAEAQEARSSVTELQESARELSESDEVEQSIADLAGAVDGLETTARQVGQGGGSIQGVIQQLQIQLSAIGSAITGLRNEVDCD